MKINESILFSLIRRGYRTLQIPDIVIGEQFSEPYLDLPEDFFEKLIQDNICRMYGHTLKLKVILN